jgi:hypothetical protein
MPTVTCENCGTSVSLNPRRPMSVCPSCQTALPVSTFQSSQALPSPIGKTQAPARSTDAILEQMLGSLRSIENMVRLFYNIAVVQIILGLLVLGIAIVAAMSRIK